MRAERGNTKRDCNMRITISMPMRGLSNDEVGSSVDSIMNKLVAQGYEVCGNLFPTDWANRDNLVEQGITNAPLHFLARSLDVMSKCDAVYFAKGWENARGCRIEHEAAKAYGLTIIYE